MPFPRRSFSALAATPATTLFVGFFLHVQARPGAADLAGIGEDGNGGRGDRLIHIGVVEDNERRFSPSSSTSRFMFPAAARTMSFPTSVSG